MIEQRELFSGSLWNRECKSVMRRTMKSVGGRDGGSGARWRLPREAGSGEVR